VNTDSDQRYIVHLDVQVTAHDSHDAIQSALRKVSTEPLGNFGCRVEEAHGAVASPVRNATRRGSAESTERGRNSTSRRDLQLLPGEFLG
jgi:hypothetical protein